MKQLLDPFRSIFYYCGSKMKFMQPAQTLGSAAATSAPSVFHKHVIRADGFIAGGNNCWHGLLYCVYCLLPQRKKIWLRKDIKPPATQCVS